MRFPYGDGDPSILLSEWVGNHSGRVWFGRLCVAPQWSAWFYLSRATSEERRANRN